MSKECQVCPRRRRFLETSIKTIGAVALSAPALGFLSSCGQSPLSSGGPQSGSGITVSNSGNNLYNFDFASYPQLRTAGGSIHVTVAAASGSKDLYVTRVSTSQVETVSTICTHAGCTIDPYDSSAQDYLCPCHGSIFGADGSVITGPATVPLHSYTSVITSLGVQVTIA